MRKNQCDNEAALLQKQVFGDGGHTHKQCGWKSKRHGEFAEPGSLSASKEFRFPRRIPMQSPDRMRLSS
jgi:hypothetical protein